MKTKISQLVEEAEEDIMKRSKYLCMYVYLYNQIYRVLKVHKQQYMNTWVNYFVALFSSLKLLKLSHYKSYHLDITDLRSIFLLCTISLYIRYSSEVMLHSLMSFLKYTALLDQILCTDALKRQLQLWSDEYSK